MKFTPDNITELQPNQIFVFGSNLAGIHGAGAAALASKEFGAVWGKGIGFSGQTYALPTKDKRINPLPLMDIEYYMDRFLMDAKRYPNLEFLLTKVGCGLAGYSEAQIANLLKDKNIPSNVVIPESFYNIINSNESNA